MFKIKSYTVGWDTIKKQGYINAQDEHGQSHHLSELGAEEFKIITDLLKADKVHIDNNKWVIGGWNTENEH